MDSRIKLRQPWFAAILAFLVPGLGHLYQGRLFKSAIYFVCICGLFLTGSCMAEWSALQPPFKERERGRGLALLKFSAQFGVGLPALGSLYQARRVSSRFNDPPSTIPASFSAPFEGMLVQRDAAQGRTEEHVTGTISLEPTDAPFGESIGGRFDGQTDDGRAVNVELQHHVVLDRPIDPSPKRGVKASLRDESGSLDGSIPRRWQDWLGVPMNDAQDQALQGRLGKWHELAMVLTWIAGLLNLLAIWDALEGPAWGYDDQAEPGTAAVATAPAARPVARPTATTT